MGDVVRDFHVECIDESHPLFIKAIVDMRENGRMVHSLPFYAGKAWLRQRPRDAGQKAVAQGVFTTVTTVNQCFMSTTRGLNAATRDIQFVTEGPDGYCFLRNCEGCDRLCAIPGELVYVQGNYWTEPERLLGRKCCAGDSISRAGKL